MGDKIWLLWFIFAVIFSISEIFTAGFFLICFGIGAAVAGILALFKVGTLWQWGSFILVSLVLFALSRKFAERWTKKQPPGIGADRLVGKNGIVLETIDNMKNTGRVRLDKEEWRADSETGEIISVNKKVKVIKIEGTHLIVTLQKEGE
ncbi:MAG: NfeD family protein [bacterium]